MSTDDRHTDQHDAWDQGGYCNALVLDENGDGDVCGYRKPTDATLSPDVRAKALADEYTQLAEQAQHIKDRQDEIKTILADLLPTGGPAGDYTVQVTRPRRLNEAAFTAAYPVAQHPQLYGPKVNLSAVKHHVAPNDLDAFYVEGKPVVKVI